ncbi:MAG: DMT family transporter [Pseudomonadales bacterium]|nr:DMT family transporter [Pseudomonadales bacterium]
MVIVAMGTSVVMLLWALCYPLIVLSLDYAPVMQTAFVRAVLGGISLLLVAFFLKRSFPNTFEAWVAISGIGLSATGIGFWGMFYAGSLISPGLATVLTNLQPLIASVLAWVILKEKIDWTVLVGIILGFVGIFVVGMHSFFDADSTAWQGVAYVIVAAVGVALSNVLLKKYANKIDIFYAMGGQLLIGSLPLLAISLSTETLTESLANLHYFTIVLTLAIPGTALPFLLWFWLLGRAPLNQLNVFSFLTPVFGLLIGWSYFDESLKMMQWLGVVLVMGAIGISLIPNKERG